MRHHLALILVAVGAVGSLYAAWSLHRAGDEVLMQDMSWPRAFPYPDGWIADLNRWYDARYPAPPGSLKLHGEFLRVRLTIGVALAIGVLLLGIGVKMGAARRLREPGRGA